MTKSNLKISSKELYRPLQTLMLLRIIFVSLLLGAFIFTQIKETQTYFGNVQTSHYLLIGLVYLLTFVYAFIFKYSKNFIWLAYFQLITDTFFVTAIIYTTGGIESIFSFLYMLIIIVGSIILYRKGGMVVASSSSIFYGLLLDLHYYDVIHPLGSNVAYVDEYKSFYLFYLIVVNIAGFYLVAYLSSYLSEQARKSRVELKEKQIDINKLELLNESIINSITSALIALDGRQRIVLFNPAAVSIFGIKPHQAYGRPIEQVLPFLVDHLQDFQPLKDQSRRNFPPFIDLSFTEKEGHEIPLRLSVSSLLFPEGDERGHILIFQDMTEINHIEKEMKKVEGLALVGELAAGIAHEIRNPMASISGSIQMLRDGLLEDNVNSRLMDIVSREIKRLNELINDFLLFARPKKASFVQVELEPLIMESLELFKNSPHWTSKIRIQTEFRHRITLQSDPSQLRQVFWNLLLNARQAMGGEGTLHILTELEQGETATNGGSVKIVIRDTGKGFDEKILPQAFTPFYTTKEGGSGLGLAIVKRIVESLQGDIQGDNHPEGGGRIAIRLPFSP